MKTYFIIPGFLGHSGESIPSILHMILPNNNIVSLHIPYDEENQYYPNIEEIVDQCFEEFKKVEDKEIVFFAHSQGVAVLLKMILKYNISCKAPLVLFAPMINSSEVVDGILKTYAINKQGNSKINFKGKIFTLNDKWINSYKDFREGYDLSLLQNNKIVVLPENETRLTDSHSKSAIFGKNTVFYSVDGVNHGFNGRDCSQDIKNILYENHII